MPELPEVETIVRDLARLLPGHEFRAVEVLRPDLIEGETPTEFAAGLRGRRVESVTRRAKNIVIALGEERLVVNLGMTGRLLVAEPGEVDEKHTGVRFSLDNGQLLVYHDVRRFGRLQRYTPTAWREWEARLGVEPLGAEFSPKWLREQAARSRVAIKNWLMDQRHVVGVGNIYASEALFRARLDPRRPANTLTAPEAKRLHDAVRAVLTNAIEFRGTTLVDYRDASGERGGFAAELKVYGRAGRPCRVCGTPIERIVQGGRSTFFCPHCQR